MVAPLFMAALPLIAEFAPGLIRSLAGEDAGDVADKVVGIAEDLTGAVTPEDALIALRGSPELQHEFRTQLASLEVELEKAYLADTQDARGLTANLAASGHASAWSAPLISLVVTLGFFGMLWLIVQSAIPDASSDVAFMMLGALAAGFQQVLAFWLGSSRGSKDKDSLMAAIQSKLLK